MKNPYKLFRGFRSTGGLVLMMLAAGIAQAESTEVSVADAPCYCKVPSQDPTAAWVLPPVYDTGGVRYRTGGVGLVEAAAMRADKVHYPLTLEFLVRDGETFQFTSRVTVEIIGERGDKLLGVTSEGPFLLADLPPGHYHVTAISDDGRLQTRDVELLANAHRELRFVWAAR